MKMNNLDVGTLSKAVVVSMHHERDGKESVVEYDRYRQGRRKKRCVTTAPCDKMFWSFDLSLSVDKIGND